jgi:hypothetical protein
MSEKSYQLETFFDFSKLNYTDLKSYTEKAVFLDSIESVKVSDFLFNVVGVDKRNIATGGASDFDFVIHLPRPAMSSAITKAQWTAIMLVHLLMDASPKKNILSLSAGKDRCRLKSFQDEYKSKITFLNNKKLALYEKFEYESTPMDYSVIKMQDLESNPNCVFDMIMGWSLDFENPLIPIDFYLDRLEDKGILIIMNSSDSMFLYSNHTQATPVWEYHNDLKLRNDCNVYHIPLFYGITIVVKNKI